MEEVGQAEKTGLQTPRISCFIEQVFRQTKKRLWPGGDATAGKLWDASSFGCVSFVVGNFLEFSESCGCLTP